jgi:hypothetical protein
MSQILACMVIVAFAMLIMKYEFGAHMQSIVDVERQGVIIMPVRQNAGFRSHLVQRFRDVEGNLSAEE